MEWRKRGPSPTVVAGAEESDGGLSAGAIAAIVGGLAAIAAVAIVLLRRRGDRFCRPR